MTIVIAAALLAAGLVVAAALHARTGRVQRSPAASPEPRPRDDLEAELFERRAEIARIEERVISKEEAIDVKLADLARRERVAADRERELERQRDALEQRKREHL